MANVDWAAAWSIVARGLGLVFGIMILLALITDLTGRIVRKAEARKKAQGGSK